jgi:hypothetical protein
MMPSAERTSLFRTLKSTSEKFFSGTDDIPYQSASDKARICSR